MEDYISNAPTLVIPRSSLGYRTNNKYKNFPPLMSDGRSIISSLNNENQINQMLLSNNGITSNWQYRQYLMKNANTIMEYNYREAANDTGYSILPSKKGTNLTDDTYDFLENLKQSDLKTMYLTREQLSAKKMIQF